MAERVRVGNSGGQFMLRTSKPGYNASSAPEDGLTFHENMRPLVPVVSGYVSVPAGTSGGADTIQNPGTATVNLGMGFVSPPKVILRNNLNRLGTRAALTLDSGQMTVYNYYHVAMTVRYLVFVPA